MSTKDGNPEIYTVNPDGSGLARLTNSDSGDIAPAWSPDGTRIAFGCGWWPETGGGFMTVGPSDICMMEADGRGLKRLTSDRLSDGEPAWSPDGRRIAFRRAADIYTMKPDGTEITRLTTDAAAREPAWSPDGSKIVFTCQQCRGPDGSGNPEIYVMNADGTGAVNLTQDLATEDGHPAWSPDGTRIAYDSYPSAGGAIAVWLMDVDGSNKVRLPPAPGNDSEPAWSPDGMKIAFTRYGDNLSDIFVRNADGTGAVAVTNLPGFDQFPDWQIFSVHQTIALRGSKPTGTISRGTAVTFTATVRPLPPAGTHASVRFAVYRRVNGTWRMASQRTVVAGSTGRATLRWTFSTAGSWYVKAQAPANATYAASQWSSLIRYSVR